MASAIRAAQDRKAVDIVVLDLRKAGGFTDYFVICTGTNPRQIHAIADAVNATLRSDSGKSLRAGGRRQSIGMDPADYFDFVVHVFSRECRTFYDLERLWGNAEAFPIADESVDALLAVTDRTTMCGVRSSARHTACRTRVRRVLEPNPDPGRAVLPHVR